jgi:hypothetical protein
MGSLVDWPHGDDLRPRMPPEVRTMPYGCITGPDVGNLITRPPLRGQPQPGPSTAEPDLSSPLNVTFTKILRYRIKIISI